jgi:hypothetical protein
LLNKDGHRMEEPGPSRTEMAQALDETKGTDYEEVIIGWQQKLFSGVCAELFFRYLKFYLVRI